MNRKISIFSVVLLLMLFALPVTIGSPHVQAVDIFSQCSNDPNADQSDCNDCSGGAAKTDVCQEVSNQDSSGNKNTDPIITIIKTAVTVLSYVIGSVSIIVLIVGGIRLITSGGNANSVSSARSSVIYALIGLAITALAQFLVIFILD